MSKLIRHQIINGKRYRFTDLGCDDLESAALNRRLVRENYAIDYWVRLENELEEAEQGEIAGVIQVRRRR